jgi:hypothetical protein
MKGERDLQVDPRPLAMPRIRSWARRAVPCQVGGATDRHARMSLIHVLQKKSLA